MQRKKREEYIYKKSYIYIYILIVIAFKKGVGILNFGQIFKRFTEKYVYVDN